MVWIFGCSIMLLKFEILGKLSLQNSGAFKFPGGVPTSLIRDSGEQWDFPNGFPPLVHMVIEGLRKSENAEMQNQVSLTCKFFSVVLDCFSWYVLARPLRWMLNYKHMSNTVILHSLFSALCIQLLPIHLSHAYLSVMHTLRISCWQSETRFTLSECWRNRNNYGDWVFFGNSAKYVWAGLLCVCFFDYSTADHWKT